MQENRTDAYRGVFSLLLTPFDRDGGIRWDQYERCVEWHAAQGTSGLFAACGSSEMSFLTASERRELAMRAAEIARPTPVIATANLDPDPANHPEEALRMADAGVAGVVLVPPSGYGLDPERLHDYFAEMAERLPVPVFLYEWPGSKPCEIPPDVLRRLTARGIVGIKDTTCEIPEIQKKIEAAPSAIVYQACAPLFLDSARCGAGGIMAVVTCSFPDLARRFWESARESTESEETKTLFLKLVILDSFLRMGHPATSKYLLRLRGLDIDAFCRCDSRLSPDVETALSVARPFLEDF